MLSNPFFFLHVLCHLIPNKAFSPHLGVPCDPPQWRLRQPLNLEQLPLFLGYSISSMDNIAGLSDINQCIFEIR